MITDKKVSKLSSEMISEMVDVGLRKVRQDNTQDNARPDNARPDKTRQDKTRQDKTRQDYTKTRD